MWHNDSPPPPQHFRYFYPPSPTTSHPNHLTPQPPHTPTTSGTMKLHKEYYTPAGLYTAPLPSGQKNQTYRRTKSKKDTDDHSQLPSVLKSECTGMCIPCDSASGLNMHRMRLCIRSESALGPKMLTVPKCFLSDCVQALCMHYLVLCHFASSFSIIRGFFCDRAILHVACT